MRLAPVPLAFRRNVALAMMKWPPHCSTFQTDRLFLYFLIERLPWSLLNQRKDLRCRSCQILKCRSCQFLKCSLLWRIFWYQFSASKIAAPAARAVIVPPNKSKAARLHPPGISFIRTFLVFIIFVLTRNVDIFNTSIEEIHH